MSDFVQSPLSDLILAIIALVWFIRSRQWKDRYEESEMWCDYWSRLCRLNKLQLLDCEDELEKEKGNV